MSWPFLRKALAGWRVGVRGRRTLHDGGKPARASGPLRDWAGIVLRGVHSGHFSNTRKDGFPDGYSLEYRRIPAIMI